MADRVSPEIRHRVMAAVKSQGTRPEMRIREALYRSGFRYRVNVVNLPGKPDIVLFRYRIAVLSNGCFWHGHGCPKARMPATNVDYWSNKIERNLKRDSDVVHDLNRLGWNVVIIWECELDTGIEKLIEDLQARRNTGQFRRRVEGMGLTWPEVKAVHGTVAGISVSGGIVASLLLNQAKGGRYPDRILGDRLTYYVGPETQAHCIRALLESVARKNRIRIFEKIAVNIWEDRGLWTPEGVGEREPEGFLPFWFTNVADSPL